VAASAADVVRMRVAGRRTQRSPRLLVDGRRVRTVVPLRMEHRRAQSSQTGLKRPSFIGDAYPSGYRGIYTPPPEKKLPRIVPQRDRTATATRRIDAEDTAGAGQAPLCQPGNYLLTSSQSDKYIISVNLG